jgi:uncharacterized surface protein with fasciclin (FAS1) repeats
MKKLTHVITFIAVFVFAFSAVFAAPASAAGSDLTIVETALAINADSGEFSTLIAAVVYTGLVPTLNGKGQFTVFAPTDAAFAKLGLDAESIVTLPKRLSRASCSTTWHAASACRVMSFPPAASA